ncbi:hypothetical protein STRTUCAR8_07376, partial [Streptomyces turgidiscabies Car8]
MTVSFAARRPPVVTASYRSLYRNPAVEVELFARRASRSGRSRRPRIRSVTPYR